MRVAIFLTLFLVDCGPSQAYDYDRIFNYLTERYLRQMEEQDRVRRQFEIEQIEAQRRQMRRRFGDDDEIVDTRPRRSPDPRPLNCQFVVPGNMVCN